LMLAIVCETDKLAGLSKHPVRGKGCARFDITKHTVSLPVWRTQAL
jgi:hypothetical protein